MTYMTYMIYMIYMIYKGLQSYFFLRLFGVGRITFMRGSGCGWLSPHRPGHAYA